MFKLMVSYNCGVSYQEERTAEHLDLFDAQCKELDKQLLRWTVEDEKGEIFRMCSIHANILKITDSIK